MDCCMLLLLCILVSSVGVDDVIGVTVAPLDEPRHLIVLTKSNTVDLHTCKRGCSCNS